MAVVELCLRQPDGWLPFNGFFLVRAVHKCWFAEEFHSSLEAGDKKEKRDHKGTSKDVDVDVDGWDLDALQQYCCIFPPATILGALGTEHAFTRGLCSDVSLSS